MEERPQAPCLQGKRVLRRSEEGKEDEEQNEEWGRAKWREEKYC